MSIAHICATCGMQFAPSPSPPAMCPICEDERQYVGWDGQQWTTLDALASQHRLRVEDDAGVFGIDIDGSFAIPQRAVHLQTDAGNLLWECVSLVTREAIAALDARGGVDRIVISHPHFYASMVEWSEALGGVEILLHANDQQWVMRGSDRIRYWEGDVLPLSDEVTLFNVGGHFAGSTALHWKAGPRSGGALFPGDALQVVQDRRHATFMFSYPNFIPMKPADVLRMRALLAPYDFADVFGYRRGLNILGNARAAIDASFDRYLQAVAA